MQKGVPRKRRVILLRGFNYFILHFKAMEVKEDSELGNGEVMGGDACRKLIWQRK
jgi:hypothetical protein